MYVQGCMLSGLESGCIQCMHSARKTHSVAVSWCMHGTCMYIHVHTVIVLSLREFILLIMTGT